MDAETQFYIEQLAVVSPQLASIWLIGSRANGTNTAISDWDFIAFGSEQTIAYLRQTKHLHRDNTDFLIVTNGDDFQAAWGELDKTGSLKEWQWKQLTDTEAEYMQSKWVEHEDGSSVKTTQSRAIKVWPR